MDFFHQRLKACNNLSSNGAVVVAVSSSGGVSGHGNRHISRSVPAETLSEELWQACAGSLSYVPRVGERVWYFPQGHMEQVTASMQQDNDHQLPISGRLSSQIHCVVIARDLSAEVETDEVYAKISLAPKPQESLDGSAEMNMQEEAATLPQRKSSTRHFIKILTASDTSTHGGFSVLRKHADECLPPLDMTAETPTQELKARDLHGFEWKFRHTYRGHPRRHLLTTGWSLFVSQKKLLAGDAVIFLRGKDEELMVGIRRSKRPMSAPQAVMSRESMHMGVAATALHALNTRTMFSVFFKPRLSSSSFLVPVEKFKRASRASLSEGMRFRMQFETDNGSDMSSTGTIIGIEAVNSEHWPDSKWRSVKVEWDEESHECPRRVSPWEIEPTTSPSATNPLSIMARRKRPRLSLSGYTSVIDLPMPGSEIGFSESVYGFDVPNVLQGQEGLDVGTNPVWKIPGLNYYSPHRAAHKQYQHQQDMGIVESLFGNRTLISASDYDLKASAPSTLQGGSCYSPWIKTCDSSLTRLITPSLLCPKENVPLVSKFNSSLPVQAVTSEHHSSFKPNIPSLAPLSLSKQDHCADSLHTVDPLCAQIPAASETEVKLFGITITGPVADKKVEKQGLLPCMERAKGSLIVHDLQMHKTENVDIYSDREKLDYNEPEILSKQSTRSCIKVIKKGSILGRGVDLTRHEGYDSLLEELEAMFDMQGELSDPDNGWQVAYTDREGDTMKVGDDPWQEFCRMVRKLHIIRQGDSKGGLKKTRIVCNTPVD